MDKSKIAISAGACGVMSNAGMAAWPAYHALYVVVFWLCAVVTVFFAAWGLVEDRGIPLLPSWKWRWSRIPLWKAAKIARSKLLNYEVQRHAEAYVKSTTGHDQYDWYATYLAEDFPLYGKKIPYPELVPVPKPIMVYDGGRRLGNLGGQTLYDEPLIDRSSLKQFIKVKRNEPRQTSQS